MKGFSSGLVLHWVSSDPLTRDDISMATGSRICVAPQTCLTALPLTNKTSRGPLLAGAQPHWGCRWSLFTCVMTSPVSVEQGALQSFMIRCEPPTLYSRSHTRVAGSQTHRSSAAQGNVIFRPWLFQDSLWALFLEEQSATYREWVATLNGSGHLRA